jgi:hypothetical protein
MKPFYLFPLLLLSLALLPRDGSASPVSYSGTFSTDDEVQLFAFQVGTSGTVTLRTFGYSGGVDGAGATIAAGGFDPVLTLFDNSGMFLETNDDGACSAVGKDPTTKNCFDAYMSLTLAAGSYTLALTEADNLPIGDLSDSFSQVGNGNFTCPEFLGQTGAFCDASPSQRDASYEVDIDTPNVLSSPVPEPAPLLLLFTGCGLAFCLRLRVQTKVQI